MASRLEDATIALVLSTDPCPNLFDWAPFQSTRTAIKLQTRLGLRDTIPAFINISNGKLHNVNVLDMLSFEAGAFQVMDRGHVDFSRLYALHQRIKHFLGTSESAVNTQIWSVPVFKMTRVPCPSQSNRFQPSPLIAANQFTLFGF